MGFSISPWICSKKRKQTSIKKIKKTIKETNEKETNFQIWKAFLQKTTIQEKTKEPSPAHQINLQENRLRRLRSNQKGKILLSVFPSLWGCNAESTGLNRVSLCDI